MQPACSLFTRIVSAVALVAVLSACTPAAPPAATVAPTSPPQPAAAPTTAPAAAPSTAPAAPAAQPTTAPAPAAQPQSSPSAAAAPVAAKPAASPAAAAQLPPPLDPPVHVKAHVSGSTVQAAVYIAVERGYYKEQGLDVETLNVTAGGGATDLIPPLVQGQVDFVSAAPNAGLWNAIARGLDVKVVIPQEVPVPGDRQSGLVVRKDLVDSGRYTGPKDLKGMRIALSGMGSYSQWSMSRILASGGLTEADVTYTTMPYPEMVVALSNKAIDAGFEVEPNLTIPQEQGVSKTISGIGDIAPGSVAASVMISPVFAQNQPEASRRFVLATMRAARDYYRAVNQDLGGKEDIFRILTQWTNLKDLALYDKLGLPVYAPNGDFDNKVMDEFQDFLVKAGVQQQRIELDRWYDRRYMDYTIGVLGRY